MRINCGIFLENKISYTTCKFINKLYLGCAQNAVYHFDKFNYDEICIINKTKYVDSFDMLYLKSLSESSYKPKCYAGGIKILDQAKKIIEIGFERVSVRNLFFEDINEYLKIIRAIGRQGVTLCIDVKLIDFTYFIMINNQPIISLLDFNLNDELLPGELFINNIDLNGTLSGPDFTLLSILREKKFKTNINYCGGIRNIIDVNEIEKFEIDAITTFTAASTILDGNQKLVNNSFFL